MPSSMPLVTIVTIICAFIGGILFIAGYLKGFKASIADFDSGATSTKEDTMKGAGFLIPFIVISAAAVVALLGVSPTFFDLAPFLSIASATVMGLLFYIEPHLD